MSQSWSGIKKRLEQDLLCENLRGRVKYFITKYRKAHDDEARVSILIDEKEVLKGNVFEYYRAENKLLSKLTREENIPKRNWDGKKILHDIENLEVEDRVNKTLVNEGIFYVWDFTKALNYYLHNSIDNSISSENPLVRLFAILDRRIGKRALKSIKDDIYNQPKWLRQFYILRLEIENIQYKDGIQLVNITKENRREIIELKVKKSQQKFIETIENCLDEEATPPEGITWKSKGIGINNTIIGYAMYGIWQDKTNRYDDETWIDRMLIDEKYQGKGYGKEAFKKLIEIVEKEYSTDKIYLSVYKENLKAIGLYQQLGFSFNNKTDSNGELIMELKLKP
ncbi:GNAT family N-acetyltransferase [Clostridiaceae bacterium M8S5]|nr:GNAT family N-acetyltransferase [Clostridiaceae bacterium M8S5]